MKKKNVQSVKLTIRDNDILRVRDCNERMNFRFHSGTIFNGAKVRVSKNLHSNNLNNF